MPGTNAVYTFKEVAPGKGDVHVYDNCDAMPTKAAAKLSDARGNANNAQDMIDALAIGDIPDSLEMRVIANDWRKTRGTDYRYEISYGDNGVFVTAFVPDFTNLPDDFRLEPGENFPEWTQIFHGPLDKFKQWAVQEEMAA